MLMKEWRGDIKMRSSGCECFKGEVQVQCIGLAFKLCSVITSFCITLN